ncbi:HopJ type III effector protein [Dasania marina]|uniref:HopJ type III effector protein n=1 Tax=Dasania marina TaxID=471499 RepID=UPI000368BE80|nr:HopJ type III effector protein [Dasania marina]
MSIPALITQLQQTPNSVEFNQVMNAIANNFDYSATRFSNGPELINEAGTNEGSCKIFAFAQLMQLDPTQTLACFGRYYRDDVLLHPEGNDHANIRAFIKHGWQGIQFEGVALVNRENA